jgi:hypothetical protein
MTDILDSHAWRAAVTTAHANANENRKLVLAYPDIAARLCEQPLNYKRPDQWTGYIPPYYDREAGNGTVHLNTSPIRQALMAILSAAAERADAGRRAAA